MEPTGSPFAVWGGTFSAPLSTAREAQSGLQPQPRDLPPSPLVTARIQKSARFPHAAPRHSHTHAPHYTQHEHTLYTTHTHTHTTDTNPTSHKCTYHTHTTYTHTPHITHTTNIPRTPHTHPPHITHTTNRPHTLPTHTYYTDTHTTSCTHHTHI